MTLFNEKIDTINRNRKCIFPFAKDIAVISDLMEKFEDVRPQHAYDVINPLGEQEDMDNLEELEPIDTSKLPFEVNESNGPEQSKYKAIEVESEEKMLEGM